MMMMIWKGWWWQWGWFWLTKTLWRTIEFSLASFPLPSSGLRLSIRIIYVWFGDDDGHVDHVYYHDAQYDGLWRHFRPLKSWNMIIEMQKCTYIETVCFHFAKAGIYKGHHPSAGSRKKSTFLQKRCQSQRQICLEHFNGWIFQPISISSWINDPKRYFHMF